MSDLMLMQPHIRKEAKRVQELVGDLQQRWPHLVSLHAEDDHITGVYGYYPYLFLEAFPSLAPKDVRSLALCGRLFATSLFLYDEVMDRTSTAYLATTNGLSMLALQFEAYRLLHEIFPSDATFWERLHCYLVAYAKAGLREQEFASGSCPWREYTEMLAREIIVDKCGVAKAVVAGLVELEKDDSLLVPLEDSIGHYYIAFQMWDDLHDWKEDLSAGIPSLLLSRVVSERPTQNGDPEAMSRWINGLARKIYYGGPTHYVLELALEALDRAEDSIRDIPGILWHDVIENLRHDCQDFLQDVDRIIQKNLQRIHKQPKLNMTLPPARDEWQKVTWDGLRFIVSQWQLGFGEARHIMRFPHAQGFSSIHEYQYGDVFQRALIADTLCDTNDLLHYQLKSVIDYEVDYLINSRVSDVGGWSYFPDLPELPPDADDLAQIMQVLLRSGRKAAVADYCEAPLSALLRNNTHPDGSFETWILPAEADRTEKQRLQAEFVQHSWGTGPDNGVIANLLYALALYDQRRFAETINRGIAFLESQQQPDGSWMGSWYHGPYYVTYVCLRLLATISSDSPAIQRALCFLGDTQHADGGWGESASDPMNTALALLGLASAQNSAVSTDSFVQAERAVAYLNKSQEADRAWPSCLLIRMELGRAQGQVHRVLSYSSRTITTSFILKATLAWHLLTAKATANGS